MKPGPEAQQYVQLLREIRRRERDGVDPNGLAIEAQQLAAALPSVLERLLFQIALTPAGSRCRRGHVFEPATVGIRKRGPRASVPWRLYCLRCEGERWSSPLHRAQATARHRRWVEKQRGDRRPMSAREAAALGNAARWTQWRELHAQLGNAAPV